MLLLNYAWQNREIPISISYGLGVLAAFFYTFGYAFQLLSTTMEQMIFWIHIQYIGIPLGPFIWLIMILQFTGNQRFLTKKNIALLSIGPLYTLIAHFTNEWHHFILQKYDFRLFSRISINCFGKRPAVLLTYWLRFKLPFN